MSVACVQNSVADATISRVGTIHNDDLMDAAGARVGLRTCADMCTMHHTV